MKRVIDLQKQYVIVDSKNAGSDKTHEHEIYGIVTPNALIMRIDKNGKPAASIFFSILCGMAKEAFNLSETKRISGNSAFDNVLRAFLHLGRLCNKFENNQNDNASKDS
jgi:hypothetical protein